MRPQEELARLAYLPSPSQWSGSQPAQELVSLTMPTSVQPTKLAAAPGSPGPGAPLGADIREGESSLHFTYSRNLSGRRRTLGFLSHWPVGDWPNPL